MLLSFLSLISVILLHILLYIDIIEVEIFLGFIDLILIFNILRYLWLKQRMKSKSTISRKVKIPPRPKLPRRIRNKYLARWITLYSGPPMLPLNRIAFLKARYRIGPYKSHKYSREVPICFLRSEAERQYSVQLETDECHPRCYLTENTESYVQYRALLYVQQGIANVGEKRQCTVKCEEQLEEVAPESPVSFMPGRRYTLPPGSLEEDIRSRIDLDNQVEDNKRWEDFEKETQRTKENLREIEWMFKVMKHGQTEEN